MKLRTKIILTVSVLLLVVLAFYAYNIYQNVMGNEVIEGTKDEIPKVSGEIPQITSEEDDWTNWRGENFKGKSKTKGIITDWSKGLKLLWTVDYLCLGNSTATWSAPVIKGNRLIIPGRDTKNDLVFCINTETGKLIWTGSYTTESGTSHGPGARATAFIDSVRVYTFGRSGDLVCWNLFDGKLLWRKNVKDFGGVEPDWGFASTPLVLDNKVFVQGGGTATVLAFDKMNGELIWKSLTGESGYSAITFYTIENEKQLLVYHGTALSALNPETGGEIWRQPWETSYFVNASTPALENNILFHSSGYNMGGQALELKKETYKVLWKNKNISAQHSDPILIDGYIYSYSGESGNKRGLFKCVELATGNEMWSTKAIGQGTITYADGYLICLDISGNLHLVKPNPKQFEKIGEILNAIPDVTHPAWTVPVIANGKLYLRYLQHLKCFDLKMQ